MSVIQFKKTGSFSKDIIFCKKLLRKDYLKVLNEYGAKGVEALRSATPKDTGLTSNSWNYSIEDTKNGFKISWYNTNESKNKTGYNFNIVMLLVYGHATKNGGWIEGYDFITPAMKPIFDSMAKDVWNAIIE